MAGTLTISTLSDGTNSTSSTNCIRGAAKAWANFNGTSGSTAIRSSYNVSSITYLSAGNYYVNFTSAMSDTNYAITVGISMNNAGQYDVGNIIPSSTSYLSIQTSNFGPALVDVSTICVSVFR